jgi:hypothetical protein
MTVLVLFVAVAVLVVTRYTLHFLAARTFSAQEQAVRERLAGLADAAEIRRIESDTIRRLRSAALEEVGRRERPRP